MLAYTPAAYSKRHLPDAMAGDSLSEKKVALTENICCKRQDHIRQESPLEK